MGIYKGKPLNCDKTDNYAEDIAIKYNLDYDNFSVADAVSLIRKTLAESQEKIDIIGLGPLCNIAALLKSEPDSYSPLNGIALVKEKVKKMYLMGCGFLTENGNKEREPEWNIAQDVESASFVMKNFPNEIIVCPFETGENVTVYSCNVSGAVYDCMRFFGEKLNEKQGLKSGGVYTRPGWDPLTAMLAVNDEKKLFDFSAFGRIDIDKRGVSTFIEKSGGKHRFLLYDKDRLIKAEKVLNEFLASAR